MARHLAPGVRPSRVALVEILGRLRVKKSGADSLITSEQTGAFAIRPHLDWCGRTMQVATVAQILVATEARVRLAVIAEGWWQRRRRRYAERRLLRCASPFRGDGQPVRGKVV